MTDSEAELLAGLRLARSRGIGPVTFAHLLKKFEGASAALEALPDFLAARNNRKRITLADPDTVKAELEALTNAGGIVLPLWSPNYPLSLKAIADAPPFLSLFGHIDLLERSGIGIVGARNASAAGRRLAASLSADLGQAGQVIISGLARGIDGAAHEAALPTGTIAVLAGGADQIYPSQHEALYHAIRERGLIISEMRFGHVATARDFPKRNRIVSGLSHGVIIVEAAERSGTLITARLANEQGREVFAVPGSPLDPRSAGTNGLIRQGATLIRDADDVLVGLDTLKTIPAQNSFAFEEDDDAHADDHAEAALRADVEALLSPTPTHRDVLLRESGVTASQLANILLDLVLSGDVEEMSGGLFAKLS